MVWLFLCFAVFALTYFKLGAMSVLVSILLAAFNFMLFLIASMTVFMIVFLWKRNKLHKIESGINAKFHGN